MKTTYQLFLCTCFSIALLTFSCKDTPIDPDPIDRSSLPDWTAETHGQTTPNYDKVFNQQAVNRLDITLTKAQWDSLKLDGKQKLNAEFGQQTTASLGNGGPNIATSDLNYFAVSVKNNGKEWYKVGFRLKGNFSLSQVWSSGSYKLPFRLSFDKFEDKYPATTNQRFYGFKELSMSPAAADVSLIRQKLASDIFSQGGIQTAQTAFYRIYINFGEGAKYCGVYTMTEIPEDNMIKKQFGDDKGNIYKPQSTFETFATADFEKKNNKTAADYSDIQAAIKALNDSITRKNNPAQWRANLEKTIDVNHFLKWLAINTTLSNWDTYGTTNHNYYLYNHPSQKLKWIPWDLDLSMEAEGDGGGVIGGSVIGTPGNGAPLVPPSNTLDSSMVDPNGPIGGALGSTGFSLKDVPKSWPLIRFLADDPIYYATYKKHLKDFLDNTFTESKINELIDQHLNQITPYVTGAEREVWPYSNMKNTTKFSGQRAATKKYVKSQIDAARDFLK